MPQADKKRGNEPVETLLCGFSELATPRGSEPAGGAALDAQVTEDAAVVVRAGTVVAVGPRAAVELAHPAAQRIEFDGGVLVPGFVDAHTHPIFFGTREEEFEMRAAGKTYLEISQAGGGILSSIRGVREASKEQLLKRLIKRLQKDIFGLRRFGGFCGF